MPRAGFTKIAMCHIVADEQKAALKKAARVSGGKDECQIRLKGRERDYWMGMEIGMLGGYRFQCQVTADVCCFVLLTRYWGIVTVPGDGSDKQGKLGAGYNNLREKKEKAAVQGGT